MTTTPVMLGLPAMPPHAPDGVGNLRGEERFPVAARRALADTQLRRNLGKATTTIRTKRAQVVAEVLEQMGLIEASRRVRTPDDALMAAYQERITAARADMTRFGVNGVPTLVVGDGAGRRLLNGNALFGRFDLLTAQLRAA